MNSVPLTSPDRSPFGPLYIASIAAPSVRIVITASHLLARSAGDDATVAPASASGFAFSGVRFHTATLCPTSISRAAILPPIAPRPATPMFMHPPCLLLRDDRPSRACVKASTSAAAKAYETLRTIHNED